jgi:hypothetical protein
MGSVQQSVFPKSLSIVGKIPILDSLLETSISIEGASPSGILVKVVILLVKLTEVNLESKHTACTQ